MIVQDAVFQTAVFLELYELLGLKFSIFNKKLNFDQKFLKIKKSVLCEEFMKIEIYE